MPPELRPAYVFRDVVPEDFPLLAQWFSEPHVAAWWDAAETELDAIARALRTRDMQPMIAEREGRPIAYLQIYDPHAEADHPYSDQPQGTLGIDMAIGPPEETGKGRGADIARRLAEEIFAKGTKRIVIDPHPDNSRAIRCYEKAGFRFIDQRDSIFGPAHLMALDAQMEETDTP
jgi:aminoglycoside 6'-N-acetyltransferase